MSEILKTDRLRLRQWQEDDRQGFAAINDDAAVMRYFPRKYTAAESNAFIDAHARHIATEGWGIWALETVAGGEFIGFVGFSYPAPWHPCAGHIEIGWRLDSRHWGKGYATEAASCALKHGFAVLNFQEIISFTAECNLPSVNVMRKIGMHRQESGFDHPRIDVASPLCRHVLYRIEQDEGSVRQ